MQTFDLELLAPFRVVFPELTNAQFETAILLAVGLSQGEIATVRNVSYPTVGHIIADIKTRLNSYSVRHLFAICQVRLVLYALQKCTSTPNK